MEEAIVSYNSSAFNNSPGSINTDGSLCKINLDSTEVTAIAAFLRAINVLENIRSANQFDQEAKALNLMEGLKKLNLGIVDTEDAIEVLEGSVYNLYPMALNLLKDTCHFEKRASLSADPQQRNQLLDKALEQRNLARKSILQ